jgi:hypothetical protein
VVVLSCHIVQGPVVTVTKGHGCTGGGIVMFESSEHGVACDGKFRVVVFVMLDISRHGVTCDKSIGSRVVLVKLDGSRHGVPFDKSIWSRVVLMLDNSRHARCKVLVIIGEVHCGASYLCAHCTEILILGATIQE